MNDKLDIATTKKLFYHPDKSCPEWGLSMCVALTSALSELETSRKQLDRDTQIIIDRDIAITYRDQRISDLEAVISRFR